MPGKTLLNPDVSWDRKNNRESWNKLGPSDQYKFYSVNADDSKPTIDGGVRSGEQRSRDVWELSGLPGSRIVHLEDYLFC